MAKTPSEIRRNGESGLMITWQGQSSVQIGSERLRKNCPCATCRELRGDTSHTNPITAKKSLLRVVESTSEEATKLMQVFAIGNYAIGISWGDGHDTGIYTFDLLEQLSK